MLKSIFLLAFVAIIAQASHLRYGGISFTKNPSNPRIVTFSVQTGYRRSFYGAPTVGQTVSTATFYYGTSSGGSSQSMNIIVTNVDIPNDIMYGTSVITKTYPGAGTYTAWAEVCCRTSNLKNNADLNWRLETKVIITANEIAGGNINNSPVSNVLPIITVPLGVANYQYQISASDPNGDQLTFTNSAPSQFGGGNQPTGLVVSSSGLVTLTSTLAAGYYTTQQIITDSFGNHVTIDYLLYIVATNKYCSGTCNGNQGQPCVTASTCSNCAPDFGNTQCLPALPRVITNGPSSSSTPRVNTPTLANGATVHIPMLQPATLYFVADDQNLNVAPQPVVISPSNIPSGSNMATQVPCTAANGCNYVGSNTQPQMRKFTWTPTAAQVGSTTLCIGVTSMGNSLPYSQHCIIIAVDAVAVCGNGIIEGDEDCDGGACCQSDCTYRVGNVCRASTGVCDAAETCSGTTAFCPPDNFASSTTQCRGSSGACDAPEFCTGSSGTCPADTLASAGTVCRASTGPCDVQETCSGSSVNCPTDTFSSSSTVCRSSTGPCDSAEYCTGSSGSCPSDSFFSSSVVCRAANGVCDVAEYCSGYAGNCPADSYAPSSTVCRGSNGVCDVPETCTGSSLSCPADNFASSSVTCRAANGPCDVAEQCAGNSASCPADNFKPSTVTCRTADGPCDVAEQCTGNSGSCPADNFASSSTVCRSSNGICDVAEQCTGNSGSCPADTFQSSSVVCRGSNGICDVPETCTGTGASCPADSFQSSSTVCRGSNGVCDVEETCTGTGASCPADSFESSTTVCRGSNGICDVEETCTGTGADCPSDNFLASTTVCRSSNGICDVEETCTGNGASCPSDVFVSSSTTCRASAGICDVSEQCTGSSASCPTDVFIPSTTTCRASAGICDVSEQCTGTGADCPIDSFKPATFTCRDAISTCDPSESCTGTGASCPFDVSGDFEVACAGHTLPLGSGTYSFMDFNVISFNNFTANTGDIEGRLAARGKVTVGKGWSVGYLLQTTTKDNSLPFALVAGGDVAFPSGSVHPDGSNRPYTGAVENMFVGGSFTGASYLASRKTGTCSTPGCLDQYFGAAQNCYNSLSSSIAANADNVKKAVVWSTLYVNCTDSSATAYYMSLIPSEMSQIYSVSVDMDSCNNHARWYVNIRGTTDVTFSANQDLPVNAAGIVYNVIGNGRKINVKTGIRGHLIAPGNNVVQTNGVIVGKLVANNVQMSLQINKNQCFVPSVPDQAS